ncbi:kinase-like domain-containing protein [Chlamydoabsidia padenii]|nr:kinase-like domain-containing protein [Chlamydoabsidia padenii]
MKWLCCFNQIQPDESQGLDDLNVLKVLGEGSFGQVRLVQHKKTGKQFALKIISKEKCIRRRSSQYIVAERQLMGQLSYPFISNLRFAFQDDEQLYMAMDYMPQGDLRQWLNRPLHVTEIQLRTLMAEMVLAIHYLHQRNVCHRDIKPENILLDDKGHAHLGDFSVATKFETNQPLKWSKAGSLAYFSPEMISQQGYTPAIDWWSLGVVAFELMFGMRPFTAPSNELLMKAILYQPLTFPDQAYGQVSNQCLQFITGLLQKSPSKRLGSDDGSIFKHPWFQGLDWHELEQKKQPSPIHKELLTVPNMPNTIDLSPSLTPPSTKRYSRPVSMDVNNILNSARPVTEEAQMREWLEINFEPLDYHRSNYFFNVCYNFCFS